MLRMLMVMLRDQYYHHHHLHYYYYFLRQYRRLVQYNMYSMSNMRESQIVTPLLKIMSLLIDARLCVTLMVSTAKRNYFLTITYHVLMFQLAFYQPAVRRIIVQLPFDYLRGHKIQRRQHSNEIDNREIID